MTPKSSTPFCPSVARQREVEDRGPTQPRRLRFRAANPAYPERIRGPWDERVFVLKISGNEEDFSRRLSALERAMCLGGVPERKLGADSKLQLALSNPPKDVARSL